VQTSEKTGPSTLLQQGSQQVYKARIVDGWHTEHPPGPDQLPRRLLPLRGRCQDMVVVAVSVGDHQTRTVASRGRIGLPPGYGAPERILTPVVLSRVAVQEGVIQPAPLPLTVKNTEGPETDSLVRNGLQCRTDARQTGP